MSEPLNAEGLRRMRALLDLIERTNDPSATINLWINDGYAHIEATAHNLPINDVRLVMGASPLEPDQIEDIIARKEAAARRALNGDDF